MKISKYIKSICLVIISAVVLTASNCFSDVATAQPATPVVQSEYLQSNGVKPLDIVAFPKKYLGQTVTFEAKFDKFSTLGLDYKTAFKSSEEYISFLIKRDDTTFDIPLSEMKLFLKRDEAEKFIDLKLNDEIQVTGTVFSDALGDAWIDVNKLILIKKAPENKSGV